MYIGNVLLSKHRITQFPVTFQTLLVLFVPCLSISCVALLTPSQVKYPITIKPMPSFIASVSYYCHPWSSFPQPPSTLSSFIFLILWLFQDAYSQLKIQISHPQRRQSCCYTCVSGSALFHSAYYFLLHPILMKFL